MRIRRPRFTIRFLMVCVAIAAGTSYAFARYRHWSHYDRGWWEAEREIWRGDVTIYQEYVSLCGNLPIREIDRNTGLLLTWIGGEGQPPEPGRVKGHNDRIALHIRWNGLPKNSLKPWERELFDLARFFDERLQHDTPTRLLPGAAAVVSPDGRNSVRVIGETPERPDGRFYLEISAGRAVVAKEDLWFFDSPGEKELLWGPAGSRIAVIRWRTTRSEYYEAFDLRTGRAIWDDRRVSQEAD